MLFVMAEGHRGHIHLCGFILICIINLMAVIWQTIELITNDIYIQSAIPEHMQKPIMIWFLLQLN